MLAAPEQDEKQGASKGKSAVASSPASPAPSGVIRVLEPACGSARLMLAMIDAGRRLDPPAVRWSTVGFDLSSGAIDFARQRWNEMQETTRIQQQLHNLQLSNAVASSAVDSASPITAPPFTVFEADMSNFAVALAQHAPWAVAGAANTAAATAASAASSAAAAAASASSSGFDVAHCLVSSIKHLLDPAEVQRHFEQVADALAHDGIYIVALHIHTLEGRSHFDRRVNYAAAASNAAATSAAPASSAAAAPLPDATAASSPAAASALPPSSATAATVASADVDEAEVDDEHTADYSRGSTKFTAELITYAPDAATMTEKMIARVSKKDDPAADAAVGTDASSSAATPSPSSPPLQTDMSLRVYTLSSLHSLLCGLSRLFHLTACYNYSDIYDAEWSAAVECQLTWPFPLPSEDQISKKESGAAAGVGAASTAAAAAAAASSSASAAAPAISSPLPAPRNWNRVYRVPRIVRAQWEDVEAIVIVLRKAADPSSDAQQRWQRECTIHRARLARILDREAAEAAKSTSVSGSASSNLRAAPAEDE